MRIPLFSTLLMAVFAEVATAQGSFTTYGQGCNNRGNPPSPPPTVTIMGIPAIGKTVMIHYSGGPTFSYPSNTIRTLFTGVSRTSYLGWSLPLRVPPWLMNYTGDCDLLCSMDCVQVDSSSPPRPPIVIPDEPRLIGAKLYFQWHIMYFVRSPIFDTFSIVSDGGEMTIGY